MATERHPTVRAALAGGTTGGRQRPVANAATKNLGDEQDQRYGPDEIVSRGHARRLLLTVENFFTRDVGGR
jgi:hypothetical protein